MSAAAHACPGADPAEVAELVTRLQAEPWMLGALDAVAEAGLPEAWVGAGVVRDVVWGQLHGGFEPADVCDIDVAYFDPADLTRERDVEAGDSLRRRARLPWEATNEAAVHTWYHEHFGGPPVTAFASVHDAVATWPETATCVAVRRGQAGLEVCAPLGLSDLLTGTWRVNPARVSPAVSRARLARQRTRRWWPAVTVIPPP